MDLEFAVYSFLLLILILCCMTILFANSAILSAACCPCRILSFKRFPIFLEMSKNFFWCYFFLGGGGVLGCCVNATLSKCVAWVNSWFHNKREVHVAAWRYSCLCAMEEAAVLVCRLIYIVWVWGLVKVYWVWECVCLWSLDCTFACG